MEQKKLEFLSTSQYDSKDLDSVDGALATCPMDYPHVRCFSPTCKHQGSSLKHLFPYFPPLLASAGWRRKHTLSMLIPLPAIQLFLDLAPGPLVPFGTTCTSKRRASTSSTIHNGLFFLAVVRAQGHHFFP